MLLALIPMPNIARKVQKVCNQKRVILLVFCLRSNDIMLLSAESLSTAAVEQSVHNFLLSWVLPSRIMARKECADRHQGWAYFLGDPDRDLNHRGIGTLKKNETRPSLLGMVVRT